MTDHEKMFWAVFNSNGEKQLHELVTSNASLKNPNNWYPYGGKSQDDRSNFGTFENQQANSGAALVEKITNSIDALLLKKCQQEGIDPKSTNAPKTIEEATEIFFNIPKGDIGELLSSERTQMARNNIQVIATGDDSPDNTDLLIWDNGDGQHPDDFKHTFLSIANNNKTDIAFVQGKYNMGSTGAVVFCGEYRYQLIASKKDQKCFENNQERASNKFGWTLVRRHILVGEEESKFGSTWYEYFAIDGETIPQFNLDSLDIGLHDNKKFESGSFIKLYSYEMPKGAKGTIVQHLYRELNQLLYKPALPFWLFEQRDKYRNKEKSTLGVYGNHGKKEKSTIGVYGNHVRINEHTTEDELLEAPLINEEIQNSLIGIVTIYVAIFKKGETPKQQHDRKRDYIGTGRNLIYVVNGQVHGVEGQSFITQDLKLNFLKDSLLVVVDCSKVKTSFRQDLFMANRSNLREGEKLELLRKKVIERLKNNQTLKRINAERKNKMLHGGDDTEEKELLENLLSNVPLDNSLTNLLKKGIDLVNLPSRQARTSKKSEEQKRPWESKRFPSIFKINIKEHPQTGKKIKSIPLNGKGIIQFETDVAEDYFYRTQEKGEFQVTVLQGKQSNDEDFPNSEPSPYPNKVEDVFEVNRSGPSDGSIKLTLKPNQALKVGDEIALNAKLTSPDGDRECIFYVKIVDPQKEEPKKTEKEPEKPELPKLIKITKNTEDQWVQDNGELWPEENWGAENVIHIIPTDGEENKVISAIAINMDSHSLKKYISKNKANNENKIEYFRKQYISKVYLHGMFLYSILEKLRIQDDAANKNKNNESSEELLSRIFMNYSDVLIHLDINKELLDSQSD